MARRQQRQLRQQRQAAADPATAVAAGAPSPLAAPTAAVTKVALQVSRMMEKLLAWARRDGFSFTGFAAETRQRVDDIVAALSTVSTLFITDLAVKLEAARPGFWVRVVTLQAWLVRDVVHLRQQQRGGQVQQQQRGAQRQEEERQQAAGTEAPTTEGPSVDAAGVLEESGKRGEEVQGGQEGHDAAAATTLECLSVSAGLVSSSLLGIVSRINLTDVAFMGRLASAVLRSDTLQCHSQLLACLCQEWTDMQQEQLLEAQGRPEHEQRQEQEQDLEEQLTGVPGPRQEPLAEQVQKGQEQRRELLLLQLGRATWDALEVCHYCGLAASRCQMDFEDTSLASEWIGALSSSQLLEHTTRAMVMLQGEVQVEVQVGVQVGVLATVVATAMQQLEGAGSTPKHTKDCQVLIKFILERFAEILGSRHQGLDALSPRPVFSSSNLDLTVMELLPVARGVLSGPCLQYWLGVELMELCDNTLTMMTGDEWQGKGQGTAALVSLLYTCTSVQQVTMSGPLLAQLAQPPAGWLSPSAAAAPPQTMPVTVHMPYTAVNVYDMLHRALAVVVMASSTASCGDGGSSSRGTLLATVPLLVRLVMELPRWQAVVRLPTLWQTLCGLLYEMDPSEVIQLPEEQDTLLPAGQDPCLPAWVDQAFCWMGCLLRADFEEAGLGQPATAGGSAAAAGRTAAGGGPAPGTAAGGTAAGGEPAPGAAAGETVAAGRTAARGRPAPGAAPGGTEAAGRTAARGRPAPGAAPGGTEAAGGAAAGRTEAAGGAAAGGGPKPGATAGGTAAAGAAPHWQVLGEDDNLPDQGGEAGGSPSTCKLSLRCALDAGMLPAVEQLVRRLAAAGTATHHVLWLGVVNSLLRYSGVWPAILAHSSSDREVLSLTITLRKAALLSQPQPLQYLLAAGKLGPGRLQSDDPSSTQQMGAWVLKALLEQTVVAVLQPCPHPPHTMTGDQPHCSSSSCGGAGSSCYGSSSSGGSPSSNGMARTGPVTWAAKCAQAETVLPPLPLPPVGCNPLALNNGLEPASTPMSLDWLQGAGARPVPNTPSEKQQCFRIAFMLITWLPPITKGVLARTIVHSAEAVVLVTRYMRWAALQWFAWAQLEERWMKAAEGQAAQEQGRAAGQCSVEGGRGHPPSASPASGSTTSAAAEGSSSGTVGAAPAGSLAAGSLFGGTGSTSACAPLFGRSFCDAAADVDLCRSDKGSSCCADTVVFWRSFILFKLNTASWLVANLSKVFRQTIPEEARQEITSMTLDILEVLALSEPLLTSCTLAEFNCCMAAMAADASWTAMSAPAASTIAAQEQRLQGLMVQHGRQRLVAVLAEERQSAVAVAAEGAAAVAVLRPALPTLRAAMVSEVMSKHGLAGMLLMPSYDAIINGVNGGLLMCHNPDCANLEGPREMAVGKACSRCLAVRYCSGACQLAHWRAGHKEECLQLLQLAAAAAMAAASPAVVT